MKRRSCYRRAMARVGWGALFAASMLACGGEGEGAPPSARAASSSSTSAAESHAATGSATPTATAVAGGSSAPTSTALTREEFCARIVKLGESTLARCNKEDENQRTYLDFKPAVEFAKVDCKARLASKVEFHADVATRCLGAAEARAGNTTLGYLGYLRECDGVLTGTAALGEVVKFPEECATGSVQFSGRCAKPAALNAVCTDSAHGTLGSDTDHPSCEPNLVCRMMPGSGVDGSFVSRCVKAALDERCDPLIGNCPNSATCYQGKCRERAELGVECMHDGDCKDGTMCEIPGGLVGKCAALKPLGEKCKESSNCASNHCRASQCTAFCGG